MEPIDLNDVVRRTIRLIANQKKFEQIIIEEALQPDLPAVCGDMNQLQQVLLNLALNACAAMPNGGRIIVCTSGLDGKVMMKVTDTGCGMKEEHLERIFEPFFTTQPVGKGTGLGLSVTYGIIEPARWHPSRCRARWDRAARSRSSFRPFPTQPRNPAIRSR